jgi:hypothetical protein
MGETTITERPAGEVRKARFGVWLATRKLGGTVEVPAGLTKGGFIM